MHPCVWAGPGASAPHVSLGRRRDAARLPVFGVPETFTWGPRDVQHWALTTPEDMVPPGTFDTRGSEGPDLQRCV